MKSYKYFIPLVTLCVSLFWACNVDERTPIVSDPTVPGKVSNINVERLPGAVKLTYNIPNEQVLSYIKAECLINGVMRQVKSSAYQNNLTIEGFADTSVYIVNLYSVSRSEIVSDPVTIEVKPLNPSFLEVFKNIVIYSDFGGASVEFKNPEEADLAITLMYIDSTGYWNSGLTTYTKGIQGTLSQRNLDTIPTTFGVFIRDRWNNMTDTIIVVLKPMYERVLDKSMFREWKLPTDQPSAFGWTLPLLWDGSHAEGKGFHTNGATWPQWFTFDLGVTVKLSRFRYWQRQNYGLEYADRNVKKLEIWGSLNPNPNGSWDDSWTYLMTAESTKPSGLPTGTLSDEDRQELNDGEEFMLPAGSPPVKFIRVKVLETWSGAKTQWFIMEMSFWGAK